MNPRNITWLQHHKKYLSVAACFVVLLIGAITIPNIIHQGPVLSNPGEFSSAFIVEADSAEELSKIVNFQVSDVQSLMSETTAVSYFAYGQEVAEVQYDFNNQTITFRKSIGTGDNSGDYTDYNTVKEITLDGYKTLTKGNEGRISLAIWEKSDFAYSLSFKHDISYEELEKILLQIQ